MAWRTTPSNGQESVPSLWMFQVLQMSLGGQSMTIIDRRTRRSFVLVDCRGMSMWSIL